jgi:Alpha/beta hydrolase domain
MGTAPLRIRLLGGFDVSLAGRPVPERAWRLRKAKSVIKLLALADGHCAQRSEIGELIFDLRLVGKPDQNRCQQARRSAPPTRACCGGSPAARRRRTDTSRSRTFRPLLKELYPSHAVYVVRVGRAVLRLLTDGHILPSDARAYVEAAVREPPW